jgi:hypothetical protein
MAVLLHAPVGRARDRLPEMRGTGDGPASDGEAASGAASEAHSSTDRRSRLRALADTERGSARVIDGDTPPPGTASLRWSGAPDEDIAFACEWWPPE